MNTEIAELDPGATPLPWAMFFGWDPELILTCQRCLLTFLMDFQPLFLLL